MYVMEKFNVEPIALEIRDNEVRKCVSDLFSDTASDLAAFGYVSKKNQEIPSLMEFEAQRRPNSANDV